MTGVNTRGDSKEQPVLEHRFERHDRSQLELKLGYVIERDQPQQEYRVEAFIFVPTSLGLNKQNYSKTRFYEDTSTLIRLKTPRIALAALAEEGGMDKWMEPVSEGVRAILAGKSVDLSPLTDSFKLLAAIIKSALRDEKIDLLRRLDQTIGQGEYPGSDSHAQRWVSQFTDHVEAVLDGVRVLGHSCESAHVPMNLRSVWKGIDEYLSLIAEEALTEVLCTVRDRLNSKTHSELESIAERIAHRAVAEYQYRRGRGYKSYATAEQRNEHLPHRRHVLKRFVSSILYLDVRQEESGRMVNNVVGMTAAAAAMLVATLAAVWTQNAIGMSLSASFIGAMVLSYIVKDRIKEHGKKILGRRIGQWLPDHILKVIKADTDEEIGRCRESFYLAKSKDIEEHILAYRHAEHPTPDAVDGRPETVLCYAKEISLASAVLSAGGLDSDGLTDIMRFNVQRLLNRMDDPWDSYQYVNPNTLEVCEARCARVYHLNAVFRMTTASGETSLERVRIILNRKGIQRLEHIEPRYEAAACASKATLKGQFSPGIAH